MTLYAEDAHVKTNGTALGPRGWALCKNGYIGIFIHCKTDSKVRVAVRSRYTGASKKGPGVLIRIADNTQQIASKDDWNSISSQFHLPAGTHFLKIGPAYDLETDTHTPVLDIESVKVSGGSFDIPTKATATTALEASDTYIENYRKGAAEIKLGEDKEALPPENSIVKIRQTSSDFIIGATVVGGAWWRTPDWQDATEQDDFAWKYKNFVTDHFNAIVSDYGAKWGFMEPDKGKPQLAHIEKTLEYAKKADKKYRLHTVVWDFEAAEPQWLTDLKKRVPEDSAAREEYKREVERRIDYLVAPYSDQYIHIDTVNESYHHPFDWKEMGWDWFAHITKTIKKKAPNALLYVNEYGVISDCEAPNREDIYGNWYLDHIADIVQAGGVVEGIGLQAHYVHDYYEPLEDFYTLHNLANSLLPITITEFSTDQSEITPKIVEESMRLAYGNPQVNGFVFFGFAENMIFRPGSELVDSNWELTNAGKAFVNLMKKWKTDTEARVRKDGTVDFVGYYGDYELTDGKNTWKFTHNKGQNGIEAELIVLHR